MKSKEMLKTMMTRQELIMKALNIAIPVKAEVKKTPEKSAKSAPAKKSAPKKAVKKIAPKK